MHPTPVVPERETWLLPHSTAHLRPGETLQGALPVRLDVLAPEGIPKRYRTAKPQAEEKSGFKGWQRIFLPVAFVMWLCALPAGLVEEGWSQTWRGIRRIFRGRVREGGWDSTAGWFVITTRTGPMDSLGHRHEKISLACTDQRLLLLSTPAWPEREAAQLLGELPRGGYGLRREPHPPRHKDRVDIAFPDGSWLALEVSREHVPWLTGLLSKDQG
ncbi:hypothetical protein AB0D04_01700 [Streptomyces sp. NPDC048483]|uniref:hypothetical protein n=1 Tax=Streptomyces sp. NPDC048483 TaxID=3154927 RepID=UPI00342EB001